MVKAIFTRDFIATENAQKRRDLVKPKLHIVAEKLQIYPPNRLRTEMTGFQSEKKNFQYYLEYYRQRKMSVIMHFIALVTMAGLIAMETAEYRRQPTQTYLEDSMYPVKDIEFPGVAICNINVISRAEAMNFAETLWSKEKVRSIPNLTLEKVRYLLRYMGTLYQFEHKEINPGNLMLLHEILDRAYDQGYNISGIMETLAPSCQSFLVSCQWQGKYRRCEELFIPRWTPDGYCCTFNYVRWTDGFVRIEDASFKIPVERFHITGADFGLFVTLNPHLEDYYYTLLPAQGFKVLLYSASDYPDGPSGGLREILLSPSNEILVTIDAALFYSSPEIMKYSKEQRKCLFNTERTESYGGSYSYSQCIMLCRVHDIEKYCRCVPFFYPVPEVLRGVRRCTINDSRCLEQYRYKWWSLDPIKNDFADPSNIKPRSVEDHLRCDCYPSCENTHFTVFTTRSLIHPQHMPVTDCMNETMGPDNMVLRISYSGIGTMRLKRDAVYDWYDLLSKYGGLCSLCLGVSILTPFELLTWLLSRFYQRRRKNVVAPIQRVAAVSRPTLKYRKRPIYWNELIPSKLLASTSGNNNARKKSLSALDIRYYTQQRPQLSATIVDCT